MGTALAVHLHRGGQKVVLLATDHDGPFVEAYRAGSPHPGIGVTFPPVELREHSEWKEGLAEAEIVVVAVSTSGVEHTAREVADLAPAEALWAVATKGWEETTLRSASRVVTDVLGDAKRVVGSWDRRSPQRSRTAFRRPSCAHPRTTSRCGGPRRRSPRRCSARSATAPSRCTSSRRARRCLVTFTSA